MSMSRVTGLTLSTSNRMELLVAQLADVLAEPVGSVLAPEIVVVQSLGMRRWLALELARAQGVCANVEFPFPQRFVSGVLGAGEEEEAYNRDGMTWRLLGLLAAGAESGGAAFAEVRDYLRGEQPELRRYQLATRVAAVFDQYLAYRPEMLLSWEAGQDEQWQAQLWRSFVREVGVPSLPARARRWEPVAGEMARVAVIGVSHLPRFYLQILERLAAVMEVHLFVLEPTPEWWEDVVSPREEQWQRERSGGLSAEELHLKRGHPLLASMGKAGKGFRKVLTDLSPAKHEEIFVEPLGKTMLEHVQRDIFRVEETTAKLVNPGDRSLAFHSCHSPARELEVLYDELLGMFERNPALQPREIVVMMPNVGVYAPLIEAVFGAPEEERLRIPFTIADRKGREENGVIDTFLQLLELAGSRFRVGEVLALIEAPAVRRRFGLDEGEVEQVRGWVGRGGICWGIDGEHRAGFDVPAFEQNSWREGLDRLLLGFALPAGGARLFEGILPYDEIEGSAALTLGKFAEFASQLFAAARGMTAARPLGEWQEFLRKLLADFFAEAGAENELLELRRVLEALGRLAETTDHLEPVPLEVMRAYLESATAEAGGGRGYFAGRVTFCALKPMRSLPFKVVCLIGMDGTAYPRVVSVPGFDLIARHPERGDGPAREEDRALFLEALLSAREVFSVSYVGQSNRDLSARPPSVLVSDLLEVAMRAFGKREEELVTRHRLQGFSAAYFQPGSGLRSYSPDHFRAAQAAHGRRQPAAPFSPEPLGAWPLESGAVELETLCRFFKNPARYFLEDRLGLKFTREQETESESEPFAVDRLDNYALRQTLLARRLDGGDPAMAWPVVRAGGTLPPGPLGEGKFREVWAEAEELAAAIEAEAAGGGWLAPLGCEVELGGRVVVGQVEGLKAVGLVRYRLAELKGNDFVQLWLRHLAVNCVAPTRAWLFGLEKKGEIATCRFGPVPKARERLSELVELFEQGRGRPLPFFPVVSLVFARSGKIDDAREEWAGFYGAKDRYFDQAFGNVADPLDAEFEELARRFFGPMLEAMEN